VVETFVTDVATAAAAVTAELPVKDFVYVLEPTRYVSETVAVMAAEPVADLAVTSPVAVTVALVLSETNVALDVMSEVDPSLSCAVTVSCFVAPLANVVVAGLTVMPVIRKPTIASICFETPPMVAVRVVLPGAALVNSPACVMEPAEGLLVAHVAAVEVEPSVYVAVAT
jgi:hypothetical protein